MAICFARLELVSRSSGKSVVVKSNYNSRDKAIVQTNVLAKAAYNSRSDIGFDGTGALKTANYDFSDRDDSVYSGIMLPEGASEKFLDKRYLWNMVEASEKRSNSQLAAELVLALADDACVSDENRKEILLDFTKKYIVDKGLIAQVDIHRGEKQANGTYENNHAHILFTTRYLDKKGESFEGKARDFFQKAYQGKVCDGKNWPDAWSEDQNKFFEERGLNLRVDGKGKWSQKHIGPRRMRGKNSLFDVVRNEKIKALNASVEKEGKERKRPFYKGLSESQNCEVGQPRKLRSRAELDDIIKNPNPDRVKKVSLKDLESIADGLLSLEKKPPESICSSSLLDKVTKNASVFTEKDIELFSKRLVKEELKRCLTKNFAESWNVLQVDSKELLDQSELKKPLSKLLRDFSCLQEKLSSSLRTNVLESKGLVPMLNKKDGSFVYENQSKCFSTRSVLNEEQKALRLASKLYVSDRHFLDSRKTKLSTPLSGEQKTVFNSLLEGADISCLQGGPGTGKSQVLVALGEVYEGKGYKVRALGPDSATASVLAERGFNGSENIHRFLFRERGKLSLKPELWLVDESSKVPNKLFLELLKKAEASKVKLVLAGDCSQFSSVDRGGLFKHFSEKFGSSYLCEVRRQEREEDRETVEKLSGTEMAEGVDAMIDRGQSSLGKNIKEHKNIILELWERDLKKGGSALLLAQSNKDMRELNDRVHQFKQEKGEVAREEFLCPTPRGDVFVSEGDIVEFRGNSKELLVINGDKGRLVSAKKDEFVVSVKEGKRERLVRFHPDTYADFQLGYATTTYRSQGATCDKVYALHSKSASSSDRSNFFVAATRHRQSVSYVVPWGKQSRLEENRERLKAEVTNQPTRRISLDYSSPEELVKKRGEKRLKEMMSSNSILGKSVGFGLSLWSSFKRGVQKHTDRIYDEDFFRKGMERTLQQKRSSLLASKAVTTKPKTSLSQELSKQGRKGKNNNELQSYKTLVQELRVAPEEKRKDLVVKRNTLAYGILAVQQKQDVEKVLGVKATTHLLSQAAKHEEILKRQVKYERQEMPEALRTYREAVSDLKLLFQTPNKTPEQVRELVAKRNSLAFEVSQKHSKAEIGDGLGKQGSNYLFSQATKHREILEKQASYEQYQIQEALKGEVDRLAAMLFGEKPFSQNSRDIRFGHNGGVSIARSGQHLGTFYDFSEGKKGGLIDLIGQRRGLDREASFNWAKDFLGNSITPSLQLRPQTEVNSWVSLKAPVDQKPPSSLKVNQGNSEFQEVARYAYRDEAGDLLCYKVRLESQTGDKTFRYLSYGHTHGGQARWALKGYQSESKMPVYRLGEMIKDPSRDILVVEGEKTAEAAQKRLEGGGIPLTCISWSGGAQGVGKTDWSVLFNKEVYIWPDNDEAGKKASQEIFKELKKVGAKSISLVKNESLKQFPLKWDLADPLPEGLKERDLNSMVYRGEASRLCPQLVLNRLTRNKDYVSQQRTNEVLWRVDERVRSVVDGYSGLIDEEVLKQSVDLITRFDKAGKSPLQGQLLLFEASKGTPPNKEERALIELTLKSVDREKEVENFSKNRDLNSEQKALLFHSVDKQLASSLQEEGCAPSPSVVQKGFANELSRLSRHQEFERQRSLTPSKQADNSL